MITFPISSIKNQIIQGNANDVLQRIDSESVDCIITSPPYSDLRQYHGHNNFNFEKISQELYRVLKDGSVLVWIVGDKTVNGDESGIPYRQVLYFKDVVGFKLHDTMIYLKDGPSSPNPESNKRYSQVFEFMFILLKGQKLKKFNPLKKINKHHINCPDTTHTRGKDDKVAYNTPYIRQPIGLRFNVWKYDIGYQKSSKDKIAFEHPAIFPEKLAEDHIKSWSNENDIILDPFMGSGTTAKMALLNNRNFVGIEINQKYIEIAMKRIEPYLKQEKLTQFTVK